MSEDPPPKERFVLLLGLPANLLQKTGARMGALGVNKMKAITIRVQGAPEFELPKKVVVDTLYSIFDANQGKVSRVIVLPYKAKPPEPEIEDALKLFEDMGWLVRRPIRGAGGWPSQPPRFDDRFHGEVLPMICAEITEAFREPAVATVQEKAAYEILRGLIAKNKMGKGNNHSHWDDMWSSRGKDLGPGERTAIVGTLLREGILGTKPNSSAGGKGDVYWVADVDRATERFPELKPLLGRV